MRFRHALLHAMRTRRANRLGLDEADRLIAGDRAGPGHPGLDHLLDAVRAPATTGELGGEQAMVAALAVERRRAALTARPKGRDRVRVPTSARKIVVTIATTLAVLSVGGTAVAAGTGHLPDGVQQRAHRLFSALGVPAPRTGPSSPAPAPGRSAATSAATTMPTPTAADGTAPAEQVAWCAAWQTAEDGGKPMNGRDRRDLIAAAGGEDDVAAYCARLAASASPAATVTTQPGKGASHRATKSHPTPHATTPSHPGRNK